MYPSLSDFLADLARSYPCNYLSMQAICYICSFVFTSIVSLILSGHLTHEGDISGDKSFVFMLSSFLALILTFLSSYFHIVLHTH